MKTKPKKMCMDCGEIKRYQNYRRCYRCIAKIRKEKAETRKKKAQLRKQGTKKYQEGYRKKLHKECWKMMSEVVRRKGADIDGMQECYTCLGSFHWKSMNAGHRFHNKLDFDFDNIHPQCVYCNKYLDGNLGEYERHLIYDYGLEFSRNLKNRADIYIRYSTPDLKLIKSALEKELLSLENN